MFLQQNAKQQQQKDITVSFLGSRKRTPDIGPHPIIGKVVDHFHGSLKGDFAFLSMVLFYGGKNRKTPRTGHKSQAMRGSLHPQVATQQTW